MRALILRRVALIENCAGGPVLGLAHLDTATILSSSRHYAQTAPLALIKVPMSLTLTVWYNTKCPVCTAGIEWQHRRLVRAARAGVNGGVKVGQRDQATLRHGRKARRTAAAPAEMARISQPGRTRLSGSYALTNQ